MFALPLAVVSLAGAPSCGVSAARAAVKATHLTIPASQSISSQAYRVSPSQVDKVICFHFAGGKFVLAATIASGGTAGDIYWAVFTHRPTGYAVSLVRGGYKLGLVRAGSDLVEADPVYQTNDPNCCPTGGFNHTKWHWNGTEFAVARTWHDQRYTR